MVPYYERMRRIFVYAAAHPRIPIPRDSLEP